MDRLPMLYLMHFRNKRANFNFDRIKFTAAHMYKEKAVGGYLFGNHETGQELQEIHYVPLKDTYRSNLKG